MQVRFRTSQIQNPIADEETLNLFRRADLSVQRVRVCVNTTCKLHTNMLLHNINKWSAKVARLPVDIKGLWYGKNMNGSQCRKENNFLILFWLVPWITHMMFANLNDNFSCEESLRLLSNSWCISLWKYVIMKTTTPVTYIIIFSLLWQPRCLTPPSSSCSS